jgi:hypothetical protein
MLWLPIEKRNHVQDQLSLAQFTANQAFWPLTLCETGRGPTVALISFELRTIILILCLFCRFLSLNTRYSRFTNFSLFSFRLVNELWYVSATWSKFIENFPIVIKCYRKSKERPPLFRNSDWISWNTIMSLKCLWSLPLHKFSYS